MSIKIIKETIAKKVIDFTNKTKMSPEYLIIDYNTYSKILKGHRANAEIECDKYEGMTIAVIYHREIELIDVR